MATDWTTFYGRVGAAAESGAPIGASIDIARTSSSAQQASQAGALFGTTGAAFFQPGTTVNSAGVVQKAEPEKPKSFWDHVGGAVSGVGRPILRALEWGTELTGNIAEADLRVNAQMGEQARAGDLAGLARGTFRNVFGIARLWDDEWQAEWDKVVDAQASIGQTMWLLTEQETLAPLGLTGTSGSERITSGGLDLLDNPNRYDERREYFSEGAAHWTTGVGDALWQVFMDPLLAAGKIGGSIKAGKALLTADDVAQVANRGVDAAQLTTKQAKARDLVNELAASFEKADNASGAITAATRSKYLRGTTDGSAIAYMMSRAGDGIDDVAERIAAREDVIYAGMGDTAALGRLAERSASLEVELSKLIAPLDDLDVTAPLLRTGADDAEAVAEVYAKANDSALSARELEALAPAIRKELDAIERVIDVGTPLRGASAPASQVGELARVPGKRDIMRVAKIINNGPLLERVSIITGQHLPGTFKLSDDSAHEVLHAAIVRARGVLKKSDPRYEEFNQQLLRIEDDFLSAGIGASSKLPRSRVMDDFNRVVDNMIAHKYAVDDPDAIAAVHNAARGRRMAEMKQIATRVYQAREAGAPPMVNTGDGVAVIAGKPRWVDELGVPVTRTQVEDYVSIIDPRRLDQFANAHFRNGIGGYIRKAETSRGYEFAVETLAGMNRLWKFGALLRPGAYFVRSQVDTQARLLAMLGPLKYAAQATKGIENRVVNMRKIDKADARLLTQRFMLNQRVDDIERELMHAGFDPKKMAPTPTRRAEGLQKRVDELKAERAQLRFNPAHEGTRAQARIAEIDAKLGALGPRAVKTREKLLAQKERLQSGTRAWEQAQALDDELRELSDQITELRGLPADQITMLADELEELRRLDTDLTTTRVKPDGEKVRVKDTAIARHVGQSAGFDRKGVWQGSKITDAYRSNDDFRRVAARIDASDSITGLMTGSTRGQLDAMRRTGNWDLIRGNDEQWQEAYLRAVNFQIRSDQLGQRLLAGQTDEEIQAWFRDTAQGRAYLRDMQAARAGSAERVIERYREHIDTLMPAGTPVRAAALSRNVTADDLKFTWHAPSDRPSVPGELMQRRVTGVIAREYEALERRYFDWVASVPETMMGRHPFYAARFEQHAKNALARAGVNDGAPLSLQQVNDVRRFAAQKARKDVTDYLFDTSKQTNIGHTLRFVSPFYGAWEDTMVKWGRIFGQNPAAAPVMWDVIRSPNAAGWVVDQDGNLIDVYGNVRDDDGNVLSTGAIWDGYVLIPGNVWDPTGKLREWTGAGDLRIAKNAANVIFQGDPWFLPGPGPIVAIPANELIVRAYPEAWGEEGSENPILKYLLPYGPTSDPALEQFMPSWAKAAKDALSQDGRRPDAVFAQLYQEQVNAERNGQADPLTDDERLTLVSNRVRNWTVLRLFGTQMPFTFQPQSRLAHYKSEYDRYRREFGPEAEERFAKDYPDFYDMAISLSVNETGMSATDESWGAVQAYRNDMAKHPEYGWFWAGAANMADGFSAGVYHAQLRQEVGPGSSTTFRSRKDPLEAARDAQVSEGWREYQQTNMQIRLRLEELGLTSLNQTAAAGLRQIRQEFLADLERRNPDWASEYNAGGNSSGKVTEFLSLAADQLNTHPELLERGDGIALAQYMTVREQMRQVLAQRESKSINATSNADLNAIWSEFTSQLVATDLGFEQAWDRVLGENAQGEFRDDLTGELYGGGE